MILKGKEASTQKELAARVEAKSQTKTYIKDEGDGDGAPRSKGRQN